MPSSNAPTNSDSIHSEAHENPVDSFTGRFRVSHFRPEPKHQVGVLPSLSSPATATQEAVTSAPTPAPAKSETNFATTRTFTPPAIYSRTLRDISSDHQGISSKPTERVLVKTRVARPMAAAATDFAPTESQLGGRNAMWRTTDPLQFNATGYADPALLLDHAHLQPSHHMLSHTPHHVPQRSVTMPVLSASYPGLDSFMSEPAAVGGEHVDYHFLPPHSTNTLDYGPPPDIPPPTSRAMGELPRAPDVKLEMSLQPGGGSFGTMRFEAPAPPSHPPPAPPKPSKAKATKKKAASNAPAVERQAEPPQEPFKQEEGLTDQLHQPALDQNSFIKRPPRTPSEVRTPSPYRDTQHTWVRSTSKGSYAGNPLVIPTLPVARDANKGKTEESGSASIKSISRPTIAEIYQLSSDLRSMPPVDVIQLLDESLWKSTLPVPQEQYKQKTQFVSTLVRVLAGLYPDDLEATNTTTAAETAAEQFGYLPNGTLKRKRSDGDEQGIQNALDVSLDAESGVALAPKCVTCGLPIPPMSKDVGPRLCTPPHPRRPDRGGLKVITKGTSKNGYRTTWHWTCCNKTVIGRMCKDGPTIGDEGYETPPPISEEHGGGRCIKAGRYCLPEQSPLPIAPMNYPMRLGEASAMPSSHIVNGPLSSPPVPETAPKPKARPKKAKQAVNTKATANSEAPVPHPPLAAAGDMSFHMSQGSATQNLPLIVPETIPAPPKKRKVSNAPSKAATKQAADGTERPKAPAKPRARPSKAKKPAAAPEASDSSTLHPELPPGMSPTIMDMDLSADTHASSIVASFPEMALGDGTSQVPISNATHDEFWKTFDSIGEFNTGIPSGPPMHTHGPDSLGFFTAPPLNGVPSSHAHAASKDIIEYVEPPPPPPPPPPPVEAKPKPKSKPRVRKKKETVVEPSDGEPGKSGLEMQIPAQDFKAPNARPKNAILPPSESSPPTSLLDNARNLSVGDISAKPTKDTPPLKPKRVRERKKKAELPAAAAVVSQAEQKPLAPPSNSILEQELAPYAAGLADMSSPAIPSQSHGALLAGVSGRGKAVPPPLLLQDSLHRSTLMPTVQSPGLIQPQARRNIMHSQLVAQEMQRQLSAASSRSHSHSTPSSTPILHSTVLPGHHLMSPVTAAMPLQGALPMADGPTSNSANYGAFANMYAGVPDSTIPLDPSSSALMQHSPQAATFREQHQLLQQQAQMRQMQRSQSYGSFPPPPSHQQPTTPLLGNAFLSPSIPSHSNQAFSPQMAPPPQAPMLTLASSQPRMAPDMSMMREHPAPPPAPAQGGQYHVFSAPHIPSHPSDPSAFLNSQHTFQMEQIMPPHIAAQQRRHQQQQQHQHIPTQRR